MDFSPSNLTSKKSIKNKDQDGWNLIENKLVKGCFPNDVIMQTEAKTVCLGNI